MPETASGGGCGILPEAARFIRVDFSSPAAYACFPKSDELQTCPTAHFTVVLLVFAPVAVPAVVCAVPVVCDLSAVFPPFCCLTGGEDMRAVHFPDGKCAGVLFAAHKRVLIWKRF